MDKNLELTKQWIQFGSFSGIASTMLFLILILVDLPINLEFLFAGLFGILFTVVGFGIHHVLRVEKEGVASQLGALFVFVVGLLFNLMLMMQLTFKGQLEMNRSKILALMDTEVFDQWVNLTDSLQLGIQFSIDLFTASAMLLFSLPMWKHTAFGKPWALSGAIIAVSLVVVKCISFPLTPGELGIPYVLGPLISLWFLAVCVQSLRANRRLGTRVMEVH